MVLYLANCFICLTLCCDVLQRDDDFGRLASFLVLTLLYSKAFWRTDERSRALQRLSRRAWDAVWSYRLLSATMPVNPALFFTKSSLNAAKWSLA